MSDYTALHDGDDASVVVDRLVLKGKGILDLCLERGKNLSMKGFIDSQLEQGEAFRPVVEQTMSYIDSQIIIVNDRGRKDLLCDLRDYIGEQLQQLAALARDSSGSD